MKKKIKLKDNINNKVIESEVEIPAKDHLEAQKKFPAVVFKNKKAYTRKEKYKKDFTNSEQ